MWLVLAGRVGVVAGYRVVFWVMKTNTFMMLPAPFALGSYVTLPLFALTVPVLIFRLIHEERTLKRDLRRYGDYCTRTRFRLLPCIW